MLDLKIKQYIHYDIYKTSHYGFIILLKVGTK